LRFLAIKTSRIHTLPKMSLTSSWSSD